MDVSETLRRLNTPGSQDPLFSSFTHNKMATHSSILAWEIPWTEEPGGLQSTGSQRVRHDLEMKQQKYIIGVSKIISEMNY